jgi:hypothetical protein
MRARGSGQGHNLTVDLAQCCRPAIQQRRRLQQTTAPLRHPNAQSRRFRSRTDSQSHLCCGAGHVHALLLRLVDEGEAREPVSAVHVHGAAAADALAARAAERVESGGDTATRSSHVPNNAAASHAFSAASSRNQFCGQLPGLPAWSVPPRLRGRLCCAAIRKVPHSPAEGQRWVLLVLDLQQRIQHHGAAPARWGRDCMNRTALHRNDKLLAGIDSASSWEARCR